MKHVYGVGLVAALALSACTQERPSDTRRPVVAPSPAAEVVGEARDCLPVNQFSNTQIRDDRTIDFIGHGRDKVWRVTLPYTCNGLRSANTFSYATSLSQLCKQDIIYPLQQFGNSWQRTGGCGLGPFVPVKLAK